MQYIPTIILLIVQVNKLYHKVPVSHGFAREFRFYTKPWEPLKHINFCIYNISAMYNIKC